MSVELVELWFKRAVPQPTADNIAVQAGCHAEELAEMFEQLTSEDLGLEAELRHLEYLLHRAGNRLKNQKPQLTIKDRSKFLDAIADQMVTGTGLALFNGMQPAEALQRVNESNWSKFVDGQPVFKANGKIDKGPFFKEADLQGLY